MPRCFVRFAWVTGLLLLVLLGDIPEGLAQEKILIWGPPPKEKPHMTKGAEGFPPLPLPVVPQRRTEKKRPPSPPLLIGNVTNFSIEGWQGSPGAVDQLLNQARKTLDIWYGWEQVNIETLVRQHQSGVTRKTPILYFCAYYPLNLTDEQRQALADYVLQGGTLLINACGQPEAFASAKSELARMMPKHELRAIPLDHPLYTSYYKIEQVRIQTPGQSAMDQGPTLTQAPALHALTLGTRAAVIVSSDDMASGWNQWNPPNVRRLNTEDSVKLGLNIMTYVTAELRLAKFLANTQEIQGPNIRPREQLTVAQLVHHGNWNPNPSAVPLLLKDVAANTSVAVKFERKQVELKDPDLFTSPLLYMTGTWDPKLSSEEVALLRRHLTSGGVLIADSAAGRVEFDVAFRQLAKSLFPDQSLTPLPSDHPLFSACYSITQAETNLDAKPVAPRIEAIFIQDRAVILYSPLGLGDGWAHQLDVYARSYTAADAMKLGTNLIVYAMQ